MKFLYKKKTIFSVLLVVIFLSLFSFNFALALDKPDTSLPTSNIKDILENAINWGAGILSFVSVIVIIIAGILWATSAGDDERQTNARKMLIAALVGLAIALAAYMLVNVVMEQFFHV
ncbi:MAG: pilin [Patescibacteria group bacterium]